VKSPFFKSLLWAIFWGLWLQAPPGQAETLRIGIQQWFGPQDRAVVRAGDGGTLTLKFPEQPAPLRTKALTLEAPLAPLAAPQDLSRLVISSHRSFEDADLIATNLRKAGIPVEVARPKRWQVWADRKIFRDTALKESILPKLQQQGYSARIESIILNESPLLSWNADGLQYRGPKLEIASSSGKIRYGRYTYPGTLSVEPNAYGTYTVINTVDLESYIRGVVPYELSANPPFEAIKAQAVIARTYVLKNRHRFAIDGYELCATPNCQVYRGIGGLTLAMDKAVRQTKGQTISYQGQLADALYTSSNGGKTASYTDLWQGVDRPYLQSFLDTPLKIPQLNFSRLDREEDVRQFLGSTPLLNEASWPGFRWKRTYSNQGLTNLFLENLSSVGVSIPPLTAVQNIQVTQRSSSGRVLTLQVQTDSASFTLGKDAIVAVIDKLPSSLFFVDRTPEGSFVFTGGGWGHGIGLSQYGAYTLANRGWNYRKILQFYFPGTKIAE
jgi:SpoIID/LytB domain protein